MTFRLTIRVKENDLKQTFTDEELTINPDSREISQQAGGKYQLDDRSTREHEGARAVLDRVLPDHLRGLEGEHTHV